MEFPLTPTFYSSCDGENRLVLWQLHLPPEVMTPNVFPEESPAKKVGEQEIIHFSNETGNVRRNWNVEENQISIGKLEIEK